MFNLPWYAWFNVLAIPLVWTMVWFGLKIAKAGKWQHQLSTVGHVSAALMIFIHWNQSLAQAMSPGNYIVAFFALAAFLYCLVESIAEGVKSTYRTIMLKLQPLPETAEAFVAAPKVMSSANNELEYVDGVLDLDDECSACDQERLAETIEAVLSPNKSIADAPFIQEMSGEFTDDELREDGFATMASYWLIVALMALIMGPPGWMAFQLIKSLF